MIKAVKRKVVKRRQQKARRQSRKILRAIHERTTSTSESDNSFSEPDTHADSFPEELSVGEPGSVNDHEMEQYEDLSGDIDFQQISPAGTNWDAVDRLTELIVHDSDDEEKCISSVRDVLSEWALECNITLYALGKLLKILREECDLDVPIDARTLLKTPRSGSLQITKKSGRYIHL